MKTKTMKICCASIAAAIFISSAPFSQTKKSFASEYRTEYTIYGDINGDNVIDSFDIISLNKKISKGQYDKLADLNCDEKVDADDAALLRRYILGEKTVFDAYYNEDTDEDGICDYSEVNDFGTNPDSKDTDSDGLSDLEEIVYTKTSPLDKFSNGTTISDGKLDFDSDGLTNEEEVKLKTDPLNEDTDFDGLTDADEINKHKTDPVNYDSDGDFIPDGDEIALSYNPNKQSTDGITNDNEIVTEQFISADSELLKDINESSSFADLSINVSASGLAENSFKIQKSKYNSIMSCDNDIDDAFELSYNQNLKITDLRLNFKLKEQLKEGEEITDYMIFRFYDDYNVILPLETKYENIDNDNKDDDILYTIVDDFSSLSDLGSFKLINAKQYAANMNNTLLKVIDNADPTKTPDVTKYSRIIYEGAVSGSTTSSASSDIANKEKIAQDVAQFIFSIDNKNFSKKDHSLDLCYIYNGSIYNGTGIEPLFFVDPRPTSNCTITGGHYNISDIIQTYNSDIGHPDYTKGYLYEPEDKAYIVNAALGWSDVVYRYSGYIPNNTYNYCFVLSNRLPDVDESVYKEIHNNGCKFYYIIPNYKPSGSEAEKLAEKYGNKIYSYDNYKLAFNDILTDKLKKDNIGLNNKMMPTEIPEKISRADFLTMLPKNYDKSLIPSCDENGMIDFYEACIKAGIASKDKYGNIRFKSLYDYCSNRTGTKNGLQQLKNYMGADQFQLLSMINTIPYFEVPEYQGTSKTEYIEAGKWNDKTYCYPPTYYSEIVPENYTILEEGVNGETINGTWVSWY